MADTIDVRGDRIVPGDVFAATVTALTYSTINTAPDGNQRLCLMIELPADETVYSVARDGDG